MQVQSRFLGVVKNISSVQCSMLLELHINWTLGLE